MSWVFLENLQELRYGLHMCRLYYGSICCHHFLTIRSAISGSIGMPLYQEGFLFPPLEHIHDVWAHYSLLPSRLGPIEIFFCSKSFLTLPKALRFHHESSFPHFSTCCKILPSLLSWPRDSQEASTISLQQLIPDMLINKGQWSEVSHCKWCTLEPGKLRN